jgi:hypothetical protein
MVVLDVFFDNLGGRWEGFHAKGAKIAKAVEQEDTEDTESRKQLIMALPLCSPRSPVGQNSESGPRKTVEQEDTEDTESRK